MYETCDQFDQRYRRFVRILNGYYITYHNKRIRPLATFGSLKPHNCWLGAILLTIYISAGCVLFSHLHALYIGIAFFAGLVLAPFMYFMINANVYFFFLILSSYYYVILSHDWIDKKIDIHYCVGFFCLIQS